MLIPMRTIIEVGRMYRQLKVLPASSQQLALNSTYNLDSSAGIGLARTSETKVMTMPSVIRYRMSMFFIYTARTMFVIKPAAPMDKNLATC